MNARSLLAVTLLAGVVGCAAGPILPRPDGARVLRATGVGAVAFGASLAETELLVGEKAVARGGDAACRYVEFPSLPGLLFTVDGGVVTRADAARGVPNALGVRFDDTTESVVSLYPDVREHRNQESLGGSNLVLPSADGRYAFVLQAAGNKIIAIRAGLGARLESAHGCP